MSQSLIHTGLVLVSGCIQAFLTKNGKKKDTDQENLQYCRRQDKLPTLEEEIEKKAPKNKKTAEYTPLQYTGNRIKIL